VNNFSNPHLHTILSACAEIEMIPPLIVRRALALHLDVIAITDHNSADNVGAVMDAASATLRVKVEVPNPRKRPAGEHVLVTF